MDVLKRTSLKKPRNGSGTVKRPRLIDELNKAKDKRLIMVLAPAGYGKTTLLSAWLDSTKTKSAWLSLDPDHNDLTTFFAHFIAAIQTINPRLCKKSQMLLNGSHLPPISKLTSTLANDLVELTSDVVVVLEDYHLIRDMNVHGFISSLIIRAPAYLHLAISSRIDPPLSLPHLRAHGYMAELRTANLRFTREEAQIYLKNEMDVDLPDHVIDKLQSLTEGWITGLKLAAISIRDRAVHTGSAENIEIAVAEIQKAHANRHIADYLLEDVFKRQPKPIREFLMRTSILDRFTAPLCDALGTNGIESASTETIQQASYVLKWIERSNLFLVPLDSEGHWYRYHHLFRELLSQRLRLKHDSTTIDALHRRAGDWLTNEGLIDEAIQHYLTAGDPHRAADLIESHRHASLDNDNWQMLERWLNLMPESVIQERPDLLVARSWVLAFRGRGTTVGTIVQTALNMLTHQDCNEPGCKVLLGEIEIHRAYAKLINSRFDEAMASARNALNWTPKDHAYVLGSAVIAYGLSAQASGNTKEAMGKMEEFITDDSSGRGPTVQRALLTIAWMSCLSGDWNKAFSTAEYVLKLSQSAGSVLLEGWSRLFLGWCHYQQNELDSAMQHFEAVAQHRYHGVHWGCAISCLAGLSLSYQAQGLMDQAEETARMLDDYTLDTRDVDSISISQAYRAHLNVLAEDIAPALHWAHTSPDKFDFRPFLMTVAPLITRIRVFAADGSRESMARATDLLQRAVAFAHDTGNVWREVELLAIQALVHQKEGRHEHALDTLDHALTLACPGHFVRSFIDLGPSLGKLLAELVHQKRHVEYARELLSFIDQPIKKPLQSKGKPGDVLIEPLTARELEVLSLLGQHLSNDEIAQALFISPVTVKSHIRNMFGKMDVKRRRFAIARAKELGLLS